MQARDLEEYTWVVTYDILLRKGLEESVCCSEEMGELGGTFVTMIFGN
jgi:hypothetical protein